MTAAAIEQSINSIEKECIYKPGYKVIEKGKWQNIVLSSSTYLYTILIFSLHIVHLLLLVFFVMLV